MSRPTTLLEAVELAERIAARKQRRRSSRPERAASIYIASSPTRQEERAATAPLEDFDRWP